jgi:hypothetical protein
VRCRHEPARLVKASGCRESRGRSAVFNRSN